MPAKITNNDIEAIITGFIEVFSSFTTELIAEISEKMKTNGQRNQVQ